MKRQLFVILFIVLVMSEPTAFAMKEECDTQTNLSTVQHEIALSDDVNEEMIGNNKSVKEKYSLSPENMLLALSYGGGIGFRISNLPAKYHDIPLEKTLTEYYDLSDVRKDRWVGFEEKKHKMFDQLRRNLIKGYKDNIEWMLDESIIVSFDEIPLVLQSAKQLLKSMLFADSMHLESLIKYSTSLYEKSEPKAFIQKECSLARIFTYANIRGVIGQRRLKSVQVPEKVVALYDNEQKKYVTRDHAEELIEHNLKLFFYPHSSFPRIQIKLNDENYNWVVFAERKNNHAKQFSQGARHDLEKLLESAPFDVGSPSQDLNIFTDNFGNAVIIDTELKNDSSSQSIKKLKERYFED